jgi:hypothetical protein
MGTRIVNVDPTRATRVIGDTDQSVPFGEEVEVDSELAERLLEQDTVWARPTAKAAKQAEKESDS